MTPLKAKIIFILFITTLLFLFPGEILSQRRDRDRALVTDSQPGDTLATDTLASDSLATDSLVLREPVKKKEPLDAPVIYEAQDSIVFTKGGYAHLYGKGKVNYENIELEAEIITMNMDSSTVFARGVPDSIGKTTGDPIFKDGDTPYESKTMRYNFSTKKGFINNVVTQQGEGYVVSRDAKKDEEDNLYLQGGRYTTCDHHDHPHFYLHLTRAKVRPKKNVVSGPAYLVIEDVPLPIALPFFFFPFSSSYQSGFIMPTYVDELNRGFGLTNGGYYFAISDMMDLKLTGEIFTKGSWALGGETNYNRRYKYSGAFSANYQVTKLGEKNMPDYSVSKDFKVVWSHRQDAKASPNSTFSASVNFSSSSYEKSNYGNLYNPQLNAQNTKTSSVSYSRSFPDQNITISSTANIAQTMKDSSVAVTLPDLNISMSTRYPFKRKRSVGEDKWYEKISFSYTGRLTNSITTKDDLLFKSNLIKDWTNGMTHTIPVSATFSLFNYINVTPAVSYTERWYTHKYKKEWDEVNQQEVTDTVYGFNRVYNYNASIQVNTKLYGMYKPLFAKSKEIQIRHVFSPSVTLSAAPDFSRARYGYYGTYEYYDTNGELVTKEYNPYEGAPFGRPGSGKQGMISMDISNNLEMKIKSDKDTTGYRKISLIDELGANLSYNMAAETRPWSDLSMRVRLKLTKSYTFSTNAVFATYAYTYDPNTGNVVVGDRTEWSYGRFGRFQGFNQSFSYSFSNDTWKKWFGPKNTDPDGPDGNTGPVLDSALDGEKGEEIPTKKEKKEAEAGADGYQAFKMPWSFTLNYGFTLREDRTKPINPKSMRYPFSLSHSLNGSGSIKLSNKWGVNFSTGYDFEAKEITLTTFSISRDLHCWNISASLSPFGLYRSYSFCIRANSSMLQDLKWDKRGSAQSSNIKWY